MDIVVVNKSAKVTNTEFSAMVAACNQQVAQHFAPAWGKLPVAVTVGPAKPNDSVIVVMDVPDASGALGYHSETGDKEFGKIFCNPVLSNGGVVLFDPINPQNTSVASVLSHEVLELLGDPYVNAWVDGPKRKQGSQYAMEVADPVENDSYEIDVAGTKVSVSNFILPAWFDEQAHNGNMFDHLGKLVAPFSMSSGGYMVLRHSAGKETQIFARNYPAWKMEAKQNQHSRLSRRKALVETPNTGTV